MATDLAPIKIGDIIRYNNGISALVKIKSPHAGGWHGYQVMGGMTFVYGHYLRHASEADIEYCKKQRPSWFPELAANATNAATAIRQSALQTWVEYLPIMQQSVLMSAIRGCDGLPKRHKAKAIVKFYRRSILLSAFDGKALSDPFEAGGGSFTGPIADMRDWAKNIKISEYDWKCSQLQKVADDFIDSRDELHAHYQIHMMHGFEIVGYKHPMEATRDYFSSVYDRLAKAYHLWPETEDQLDLRLSDNFDNWNTRSDLSSSCSD